MSGFTKTLGGELIDPRFAEFGNQIDRESWRDEPHAPVEDRALLTGRQIADALGEILLGMNPRQAAQDAWANRAL